MKEIRIGILHSLSGTMASSERPLVDAALFSIDEINKKGGILGKQLLGIVEDACSDPEIFRLKAEKLLEENDVHVLSGCWTSSSRKAVQEIIQEKNVFLLYPVQYEGLEENPNILYSGSCLNQQISPAIDWCLSQGHKNFYLVGSDYVFPKTANALIKSLILDHGANILGEDYLPLGATDFKDVTKSIKSALPDFVINTINGDSNAGFFAHYNKSGNEFPVMSFSISENDLENHGIQSAPHYLCWSYFHNFDNKVNQRFIRDFRKYNNNPIVSDPMVMTYSQIRLWSQAVEEAGSLDIEDIQAHIHGQKLNSPAGLLEVMSNNHILKSSFIGKQTSDRKFEVIWESDKRIKPKPWLGMEDVELPSGKLILDALNQFPNLIHLNTELKNTKRELEKTEKELRIESGILEERVVKRTKELQESETKYIDLYDHAPDMFVSIDAKTSKILRCNQTVISALGYNKDELIGQPIFIVYHPDCIEKAKKYFQQFVETGEIHDAELQLKRKDGSKIDVSMNVSAVRDKKGKVLYSRSIWRDITERKQAEEAKEQSQSLLKAALESTADGILVVTREGRWSSFNRKFIDMWGIPASIWEANDDKAALEYVINSLAEPDEFLNKVRELYVNPERDSFDMIKMKDGRIFERYSHPQWLNEEVVGRVWSFRDVTERKSLEEKILSERDKFNSILQELSVGVAVLDSEDKYVYINSTSIKIDGYKVDPNSLMGKDVKNIHPKHTHTTIEKLLKDFKSGKKSHFSREAKRGKRSVEISYHAVRNAAGEYQGLTRLVADITERKQAENKIQKSLREKEVLLKEIHHRVKNNLQVISSLLNLQSKEIKGIRNRDAFDNSRDRIRSIALVHEILYQSEDYSRVNFREYLKRLTEKLFRVYQTEAAPITLELKAASIMMTMDLAIPCGIVVNELVTNALKHAFPQGREGKITISFRKINRRQLELIVQDNGVGFPEQTDEAQTSTLGMKLVSILVKDQLKGNLEIERDGGTIVRVQFPI